MSPRAANAAATLDGLFRTHYTHLYSIAYRYLRSRALAEEAIQDAFLAMWERRGDWGQARDLLRYTGAVVRNRALGHLRRERLELGWRQRAAGSPEDSPLSQFARDAGAGPETGDLAERVRIALRALVVGTMVQPYSRLSFRGSSSMRNPSRAAAVTNR